jgi:hypothetical protein
MLGLAQSGKDHEFTDIDLVCVLRFFVADDAKSFGFGRDIREIVELGGGQRPRFDRQEFTRHRPSPGRF